MHFRVAATRCWTVVLRERTERMRTKWGGRVNKKYRSESELQKKYWKWSYMWKTRKLSSCRDTRVTGSWLKPVQLQSASTRGQCRLKYLCYSAYRHSCSVACLINGTFMCREYSAQLLLSDVLCMSTEQIENMQHFCVGAESVAQSHQPICWVK